MINHSSPFISRGNDSPDKLSQSLGSPLPMQEKIPPPISKRQDNLKKSISVDLPKSSLSRPAPKEISPKDESLFKGNSEFSRYKFKRSLEKGPLRKELAEHLKVLPYHSTMKNKIKELEEMLPNQLGSTISKGEAGSALRRQERIIERQQYRNYAMGGFTKKESWQIKSTKSLRGFLEKILGFDKK